MKLAPDSPEPFRQAQRDAQNELQVLDEKIPMVLLIVEGADSQELAVSIDDQKVSDEELRGGLLGVGLPVDPGEHTMTIRAGDRTIKHIVKLAAAQKTERVTLRLGGKQ